MAMVNGDQVQLMDYMMNLMDNMLWIKNVDMENLGG